MRARNSMCPLTGWNRAQGYSLRYRVAEVRTRLLRPVAQHNCLKQQLQRSMAVGTAQDAARHPADEAGKARLRALELGAAKRELEGLRLELGIEFKARAAMEREVSAASCSPSPPVRARINTKHWGVKGAPPTHVHEATVVAAA